MDYPSGTNQLNRKRSMICFASQQQKKDPSACYSALQTLPARIRTATVPSCCTLPHPCRSPSHPLQLVRPAYHIRQRPFHNRSRSRISISISIWTHPTSTCSMRLRPLSSATQARSVGASTIHSCCADETSQSNQAVWIQLKKNSSKTQTPPPLLHPIPPYHQIPLV